MVCIGKVAKVRGSWQFGRLEEQVIGSAAKQYNEATSIAMIVMRSKVTVILPEILLGRRTSP